MPFRRTKSKKRRIKSKRQNTNRKQKKKQTIAYRKKQLLTGGINVENESAGNVETESAGNVETESAGNVETESAGNVENESARNVENESAENLQECLKLEEEQDRKNTETKKACEENNKNKFLFKVKCDDEYKEDKLKTEAKTRSCIKHRMDKNSKLSLELKKKKK